MEMSATQKVGQEIKKVRYRMGMTQKELGKLIGKSESQIGAYENASASITLDVLFKIAEVTKNQTGRADDWSSKERGKNRMGCRTQNIWSGRSKNGYDNPGGEWLRCRAAQKAGDAHRKGSCILCTRH